MDASETEFVRMAIAEATRQLREEFNATTHALAEALAVLSADVAASRHEHETPTAAEAEVEAEAEADAAAEDEIEDARQAEEPETPAEAAGEVADMVAAATDDIGPARNHWLTRPLRAHRETA